MPRKKSPTLTEAELRLMDVLWSRGPSTVAEVTKALPQGRSLAYSSVLTTLRILEQKGYARHELRGRAFVYHTTVGRQDAQRSVVRYVVSRFFEGSAEQLVLNILENEGLDLEDLQRLRGMVEGDD